MKRIWHPWTAWECYRAGFYESSPPDGVTPDGAREMYREFLSDLSLFRSAMKRVAMEWPTSCEHFLTNQDINRIAWLGQSSMCIETGVSSVFRGGFKLLTVDQQRRANAAAGRFLEEWLGEHRKKSSRVRRDLAKAWIPGRHPGRSPHAVDATSTGAVVQGDLFRTFA